jgi:hypothetical protein
MDTEEQLTERKYCIRFLKTSGHSVRNPNIKQMGCVACKLQSVNQQPVSINMPIFFTNITYISLPLASVPRTAN